MLTLQVDVEIEINHANVDSWMVISYDENVL